MPSSKFDLKVDNYDDEDFDGYKSAFLDEDTGEVYEGSWFNGMRHGKGICLYTDGTMYEG